MKKPQISWERPYLQEFCLPISPLERVRLAMSSATQVPPLFYFADKVQARNPIGTALTYNRLKNLEPDVDMSQLADLQVAPLTTIPFTQWWSEWQDHLFCGSLKVYCIALDENYQGVDDEVNTEKNFSCCILILHCLSVFWQIFLSGRWHSTPNSL